MAHACVGRGAREGDKVVQCSGGTAGEAPAGEGRGSSSGAAGVALEKGAGAILHLLVLFLRYAIFQGHTKPCMHTHHMFFV